MPQRTQRQTSLTTTLSGSAPSLSAFGAWVEQRHKWGVVVSGSGTVGTGEWSGTFEEVLEDIGTASGFSVAWNDDDGVITLSAD